MKNLPGNILLVNLIIENVIGKMIMNHVTRAAVLEVVGRVAHFALGVVTTLAVIFNVL